MIDGAASCWSPRLRLRQQAQFRALAFGLQLHQSTRVFHEIRIVKRSFQGLQYSVVSIEIVLELIKLE